MARFPCSLEELMVEFPHCLVCLNSYHFSYRSNPTCICMFTD